MPGNPSLRIALVHLNVHYKQPARNREALLRLNREAARSGAALILNTEMAVAGFSFLSREDVAPFVETRDGATIEALADLAAESGVYIGVGLPEVDEASGIFYNSAFVLGPVGRIVCRYRKVSAEARWACPGPEKQDAFFDTVWGRIGVLICSDTYYGLMPRMMALRGVDLLWVPANWPPGGFDPLELWQGRACENGLTIAACNRTGKDRIMDCSSAVSCVFGPGGEALLASSSADSAVFLVDLLLDADGRLSGARREARLADRTPACYRPLYLDCRLIDDMTAHYGLPEPGEIGVHCLVPGRDGLDLEAIEGYMASAEKSDSDLLVLPRVSGADFGRERIEAFAKRCNIAVAAAVRNGGPGCEWILTGGGRLESFRLEEPAVSGEWPFPAVTFGPAKIALAPLSSLAHPELAVAFSKLGCDIVLASEDRLTPAEARLGALRTLEGLSVAVCAWNEARIFGRPEGHERWSERVFNGPGICSEILDTRRTRRKRFQDRVDFDLLLKAP